MATAAELALILETLGKSANEVAAALKGHGIQGVRNTSRDRRRFNFPLRHMLTGAAKW
jgi:hypothetical protein